MTKLQVEDHPRNFRPQAVYDGSKNLFAFHDVLGGRQQITFEINMSRRAPVPGQHQSGLFSVTLKQVQKLTNEDLQSVLKGFGVGLPVTTTSLQALNVVVQQSSRFSADFSAYTRYAAFTDKGKDVYGGFEIWSGFFQSVRPTTDKLYINVDTATAVMYQSGYLPDVVLAYLGESNRRLLSELHDRHPAFQKVKSFVEKLKLEQENYKKVRSVKKILCRAGGHSFELRDGQQITVQDYFKTIKNRPLQHPDWPGIITPRDDIVPFELLRVRPGQIYKKPLSPDMMTRVLNFSKKRPEDRFNAIRSGVKRLALTSSPYVVQSGMTIGENPIQIEGRLLKPPALQYDINARPLEPRNGAWNLVGTQLHEPMRVFAWAVVSFDPRSSQQDLEQFTRKLYDCMTGLGMGKKALAVADPTPPVRRENPARVEAALQNAGIAALKSPSNVALPNLEPNTPPSLIVVVLQDNTADIKKQVKQWGDIIQGVPTQCVKGSKMARANDQYLKNLCLKINAKLGGVNLTPVGPDIQWFQRSKAMVIGIDVTHPGPGAQKPSMAGLVVSIDKNASKYIATTSIQPPRVEIVQNLTAMLMNVIPVFNSYRKAIKEGDIWPEHLIIFRDGVSEGELHSVVDREFSQVKGRGMPANKPKITFIVVGKRHHIRFAPSMRDTADKSGNCPAGFIVDDKITSPGIFDFYLQSQGGLLGTSRPSHYIVVKDENNFTSDQNSLGLKYLHLNRLQAFCFTLCHTYARATRSVSIPAPVYYADIVCERVDYHFHSSLNYDNTDAASTNTGKNDEFDMKKWLDGYKGTHKGQSRNMYFM
ncbi:Piwi-domain-containing protein [Schizopora paradoxa]|uniref:Piwi-domain-containing protein n=1 Tax=Schizopora paradoxa TaxID=27342 RepID=A0A0H2RQF3_9AGAM|nr:Piwi-domain-containing protein [Schizopora paradoxa]